ncbi:POM121C [Branchiostoma lanceolatum]|uniref:POM121C protein n=1 Tax=Branchiostoma lanceolatum TaxID=7740 RepID=A0A8J9VSE6_BRALA|nr:POM121C [Branchiostoma lanceolatum]
MRPENRKFYAIGGVSAGFLTGIYFFGLFYFLLLLVGLAGAVAAGAWAYDTYQWKKRQVVAWRPKRPRKNSTPETSYMNGSFGNRTLGSSSKKPFTPTPSFVRTRSPEYELQSSAGPLLPSPGEELSLSAITRRLTFSTLGSPTMPVTSPASPTSVARRYPTHQAQYTTRGTLPHVRWQGSLVSRVLSPHGQRGNSQSPVTVKIAAPPPNTSLVSSPSLLLRPSSRSSAAEESPSADPCDTETVVQALRQRRKRSRTDSEEGNYDKRRRKSSVSSVSSAFSAFRTMQPHQEGEPVQPQAGALKRPALRQRWEDNPEVLKRVRNGAGSPAGSARNAFNSSFNSFRRGQDKLRGKRKIHGSQNTSPASSRVSTVGSVTPSDRNTPDAKKIRGSSPPSEADSIQDESSSSAEGTKPADSDKPAAKEGAALQKGGPARRRGVLQLQHEGLKLPPPGPDPGFEVTREIYEEDRRRKVERVKRVLQAAVGEEQPASTALTSAASTGLFTAPAKPLLSKPDARTDLSRPGAGLLMTASNPAPTLSLNASGLDLATSLTSKPAGGLSTAASSLLTSAASAAAVTTVAPTSTLAAKPTETVKPQSSLLLNPASTAPTALLTAVAAASTPENSVKVSTTTAAALNLASAAPPTFSFGNPATTNKTALAPAATVSVPSTAPPPYNFGSLTQGTASSTTATTSGALPSAPILSTGTNINTSAAPGSNPDTGGQEATFPSIFGPPASNTAPVSSTNASAAQPSSTGLFSFGSQSSTVNSKPETSTTSSTTGGFNAGSLSGSTTSGFTFNANTSATSQVTSTTGAAFSFGSGATSTSGFGTGTGTTASTNVATTQANSNPTQTGLFAFGGATSSGSTTKPATPGSAGFSFGSTQPATTAPAGFSFNAATSSAPAVTSTGTGLFNLSGKTTAPSLPAFGQAATTTAPAFGQTTTGTASFGQPAPTTGASSSGFSFGQGTKPSAAATPFSFGGAPKTTAATSSGLGFGTTMSTTTTAGFSFGAAAATTTTTAAPGNALNAFGATKTSSTSNGPFGGNHATPFQFATASTQASSTFSFGQKTNSSVPTFGTSTTTAAPAFGASTTAAPTFGASTTTAPAFGASSVPAFGASASTTPAFGSSTTNQPAAPAFGASSATQNPFGATQNAFGGAQNAFGTSTANAAPVGMTTQPAFGQTNTGTFGTAATATPTFGAPSTQNAFGATATQNAFGTSSGFGAGATTTTASTAGFNFASAAQPAGFGTPQQSSGMFKFGQTNTPEKPAFVAQPPGTPTPSFNFAAGTPAGTPTFGTPAQPNFGGFTPGTPGTPGGFSIGSTQAAAVTTGSRTRDRLRAKRRGNKR